MFDFLKKKKPTETSDPSQSSSGLFARLKQGLAKTRSTLMAGMANIFLGKKELNAELLNEIETVLLSADVGVETTEYLMQTLTQKLARKELNDAQAAFSCLQAEMKSILET